MALINQSTKGRIAFVKQSTGINLGSNSETLFIKDIDLDGKCDLVSNGNSATSFCRNISSFEPGSAVVFDKVQWLNFTGGGSGGFTAFDDLDGDRKPDAATFNNYGPITLSKNNSTPGDLSTQSFSEQWRLSSGTYSWSRVYSSDLDDNLLPELIVANGSSVDIYKNQTSTGGNSQFTFGGPYSAAFPTSGNSLALPLFTDIDGDARTDIVSIAGSEINMLKNLGSLDWKQSNLFRTGTYSGSVFLSSIASGDLDGNGKPELITTNSTNYKIVILHDNPGGKPIISNFNPQSAGQGSEVTITGYNLAKVSEVTFGGKPAASFKIHTSGTITAIVGAGNSGKVKLISLVDSASMDGFAFVPAPLITSFSPSTAIAGSEVTIIGENLKNLQFVSFGGIKADSVRYLTSGKIVAIVKSGNSGKVSVTTSAGTGTKDGFTFMQSPFITAAGPTTFASGGSLKLFAKPAIGYTYTWWKDGQLISNAKDTVLEVTQSGKYHVNVQQGSLQLASNSINVTTIFTLPASNFKLQITGESCKTSDNGSVTITTEKQADYQATIAVNGKDSTYSFNSFKTISGLEAGLYNLCITVKGYPEFKRCFDLVISEPRDLSLVSHLNGDKGTVTLEMDGGDVYYFTLNGKEYQTSESSIELPCKEGKNDLKLWSGKACQGTIIRSFENRISTLIYPQPFDRELTIETGRNIPVKLSILSLDGKVLTFNKHKDVYGKYVLELQDLLTGTYLLKIVYPNSTETFKIIKR